MKSFATIMQQHRKVLSNSDQYSWEILYIYMECTMYIELQKFAYMANVECNAYIRVSLLPE